MKIYLAGPMVGRPELNFPAFHAAAKRLRAEGHEVFNPAERDIERDGKDWGFEVPDGDPAKLKAAGFSLRVALGDDLTYICGQAEAVALLPGWEKSKGSMAEYTTAKALGIKIILLDLAGVPTPGWPHLLPPEDGPLNTLARECHASNQHWWHDPATGARLDRNKGELLMLIVSEIAEAMEGERKSLMDDKLPHRKMAEVELADTLIRIFDYAGAYHFDLDGAVREKRAYNATRADHKPAARLAAGGKRW